MLAAFPSAAYTYPGALPTHQTNQWSGDCYRLGAVISRISLEKLLMAKVR